MKMILKNEHLIKFCLDYKKWRETIDLKWNSLKMKGGNSLNTEADNSLKLNVRKPLIMILKLYPPYCFNLIILNSHQLFAT